MLSTIDSKVKGFQTEEDTFHSPMEGIERFIADILNSQKSNEESVYRGTLVEHYLDFSYVLKLLD